MPFAVFIPNGRSEYLAIKVTMTPVSFWHDYLGQAALYF